MKKSMILLFVLTLTTALYAQYPDFHNISDKNGLIKASWSPFQLAFVPEPYGELISSKADIYGLALGVFVLEQQSAVISVSLTSGQHINYGLQCAGFNLTDLNYGFSAAPLLSFIGKNYGLQAGVFNVEVDGFERNMNLQDKSSGLQIGVFNIGQGFQIGLLNYNTKASIPVLPIFNFAN